MKKVHLPRKNEMGARTAACLKPMAVIADDRVDSTAITTLWTNTHKHPIYNILHIMQCLFKLMVSRCGI